MVSGWNAFAAEDAASKEKAKPAGAPRRMVLNTPDGKNILLKEDNTWEPDGNKEMIVEKDFTVPLNDGRFVLITADGTWGFVGKEVQYAEDMLTIDKVVARGTGQSIDVNAATNAAGRQALDNAVLKTRDALKKIKVDTKKIRECIERVEKDMSTDEQFAKGKGWTVTVTMTLDKGSLLAVVDCARDTTSAKAK
jgi:hypothetical protein